jgi:hypothetical protein
MRGVLLGLGAVLILGACSGGGGTTADERQAAVYAAAIRTVAVRTSGGKPFDGPVYVVAARGHELGIEVQAEVVEHVDDVTVRFVDGRDEAIEESNDDAPVLDDGLLITLGKLQGTGNRRTVLVDTYVRAGNEDRYEVTLERREGRWVVTAQDSQNT